jgi:hypothetical protein
MASGTTQLVRHLCDAVSLLYPVEERGGETKDARSGSSVEDIITKTEILVRQQDEAINPREHACVGGSRDVRTALVASQEHLRKALSQAMAKVKVQIAIKDIMNRCTMEIQRWDKLHAVVVVPAASSWKTNMPALPRPLVLLTEVDIIEGGDDVVVMMAGTVGQAETAERIGEAKSAPPKHVPCHIETGFKQWLRGHRDAFASLAAALDAHPDPDEDDYWNVRIIDSDWPEGEARMVGLTVLSSFQPMDVVKQAMIAFLQPTAFPLVKGAPGLMFYGSVFDAIAERAGLDAYAAVIMALGKPTDVNTSIFTKRVTCSGECMLIHAYIPAVSPFDENEIDVQIVPMSISKATTVSDCIEQLQWMGIRGNMEALQLHVPQTKDPSFNDMPTEEDIRACYCSSTFVPCSSFTAIQLLEKDEKVWRHLPRPSSTEDASTVRAKPGGTTSSVLAERLGGLGSSELVQSRLQQLSSPHADSVLCFGSP